MGESLSQVGIWDIIGLFLSAFIGAIIALALEKNRKPKLVFSVYPFPSKGINRDHVDYAFYSIWVTNVDFRKPYSFITTRRPAVGCKVDITYYEKTGKKLYCIKGRWSENVDPAYNPTTIPIQERYHDLMTISENGGSTEIDIIITKDDDTLAYVFNNESYLHDWINPLYAFKPGEYWFNVKVTTQNNLIFSEDFCMINRGVFKEVQIFKMPIVRQKKIYFLAKSRKVSPFISP